MPATLSLSASRRTPGADRPPPGGAVEDIERTLNALDRFGRDHDLDRAARTALRTQIMLLVDRLEIERGKRRILEGNFGAARYHLDATRERRLTLRLVTFALQVAPRLVRLAYRCATREASRRAAPAGGRKST
jgi:hypothetical protein